MNKIIEKLLCKCSIHKYPIDTQKMIYLYENIYQIDNWCARCGRYHSKIITTNAPREE